MEINVNLKNVADYLKMIVNSSCEEGFLFYPEIEGKTIHVSVFEIIEAINVLQTGARTFPDKTVIKEE